MVRLRRDRVRFAIVATLCVALLSQLAGPSFALTPSGMRVPFARPASLLLPVAQPSGQQPAGEPAPSSPAPVAAPRGGTQQVRLGDLQWLSLGSGAASGPQGGTEQLAEPTEVSGESTSSVDVSATEAPVGDVIVRLAPEVSDAEVWLMAARNHCSVVGHIGATYRLTVDQDRVLADTVRALRAEEGVLYAEPDWGALDETARQSLHAALFPPLAEDPGEDPVGSSTPVAQQMAERNGAEPASQAHAASTPGQQDGQTPEGHPSPAEPTPAPDPAADGDAARPGEGPEASSETSGSVSSESSGTPQPASGQAEPKGRVAVETKAIGNERTSFTDATGQTHVIDSALVPSSDPTFQYENKVNDFRVRFREMAAGDAILSLQRDGWQFGYSLEGADLSDPLVQGNVITFRNAFDDVDVRYTIGADSVKEDLILHRLVDRDTYTFFLDIGGLDFGWNADGSLAFTDPVTGALAFELTAPVMYDSSEDGDGLPAISTNVGMAIRNTGTAYALDLIPDMSWIRDPSRVFPVMIDPTIYTATYRSVADTYVSSAAPGSVMNGKIAYGVYCTYMGYYDGTTGYTSTYVKFPTDDLVGKDILYAALDLYCHTGTGYQYGPPCPQTPYTLAMVSAPWSEYTMTWNNQPGVDYGHTQYSVAIYEWTNANVTFHLKAIADGVHPDYGFALWEHSGPSTFKKFVSWEHLWLDPSAPVPSLYVEYNGRPVVTPQTADSMVATSSKPKISWSYEDPDRDPLAFVRLQVSTKNDFSDAARDYFVVDANVDGLEFTLPGLEDGIYYWRIRGCDGLSYSKDWSTSRMLEIKAAYIAEMTDIEPGVLPAGAVIRIPVELRNAGELPWSASGPSLVRLVTEVYDAQGLSLLAGGSQSELPYDLPSGQSVRIDAILTTPQAAGSYRIKIHLLRSDGARMDLQGLGTVYERPFTVQTTYNVVYFGRAPPMVAQETTSVTTESITVINDSAVALSSTDVRLGYRIVDRYGVLVAENTVAGSLSASLGQYGYETIAASLTVDASVLPGSYQLVWDLYSTSVGWLSGQGVRPLTVLLNVRVFGSSPARPFAGPVDLTTGNLVLSSSDASIAGAGPALGITRTYNSLSTVAGAFGYGISSNLDTRVQEIAGGAQVVLWGADGSRQVFTRMPDNTYRHPAGVYLTMVRNADGSYIAETPDFTQYRFAGSAQGGVLLQVADRFGVNIAYVRDGGKVIGLERRMSAAGEVIQKIDIAYNTAGLVSSISHEIKDFNGVVGSTRLVQTAYAYAGYKLQEITVDPAGLAPRTWISYESSTGLIWLITDPADSVTAYSYDNELRVYSITSPPTSGTTTPVTRFCYDGATNQYACVEDPAGKTSCTWWNTFGNAYKTQDALGNHTHLYWNDFNDVVAVKAPNSLTVKEYDGVLVRPAPDTVMGGPRLTEQPVRGNVTAEYSVDESSHTWTCERYTFDSQGRPLSGKDKDGASVTLSYDAQGNAVAATDSLGNSTFSVYDQFGHVIASIPAVSGPNLLLYDRFDALSSVWDVNSTSPTSVVRIDTAFGNDGACLRIGQTVDNGDAADTWISRVFAAPLQDHVVEVSFYDDGASPGAWFTGVAASDGVRYVGFFNDVSPTYYSYQLPGGSWQTGNRVMRSVGWHTVRYRVDSTGIYISIDGVPLAGTSGSAKSISRFMAGCWHTIPAPWALDDFRVYEAPLVHDGGFESAAFWDNQRDGFSTLDPSWTVTKSPQSGTVQLVPSGPLGKTGTSVALGQTIDDGDTIITREFLPALDDHVIEISFYDTGQSGAWYAQTRSTDGLRYAGYSSATSATHYTVLENLGTWTTTVTSVPRSVGWHTVRYRVNAAGVTIYIDGQQVASTARAGTTITAFSAGCWNTVPTPVPFDDFRIYPDARSAGADPGWHESIVEEARGSVVTSRLGRQGTQCVQVTHEGGTGRLGFQQTVPVVAGETYTLRGYVKLLSAGTQATVGLLAACGSDIHSCSAIAAGDVWQPLSITFTVPQTVTSVTVYASAEGTASALFDDIAIERHRSVRTIYDSHGNYPVEVIGADGQIARYEYDSVGHVVKSYSLVNGVVTNLVQTEYDGVGRVVKRSDALGGSTSVDYHRTGRLVTATTVLNATETAVSTVEYNAYGRVVRQTDALGHVTESTYDLRGLLVAMVEDSQGAAVTTTYAYEYLAGGGSRTTTSRFLSTGESLSTTHEYDALGRLVRQIDPIGNATPDDPDDYVTTYTYDAFGHLITETDALGNVTLYTYAGGRLVGVTKSTVAASPVLTDAFETLDALRWSCSGTPALDGSRHRDGTYSVRVEGARLTHTFAQPATDVTLEVAFFDEQADNPVIQLAVVAGGALAALEISGPGSGVYRWRSGASPTSADTLNNTPIGRARGWHQLRLVVGPDGTDCFLDGIYVGYSSVDRIESIRLGSTSGKAWFDDLKVYKTTDAGGFSRGKNVASLAEGASAGVGGHGLTPKLIDGVASSPAATTSEQFTQVRTGPTGSSTWVSFERAYAVSEIDICFNDFTAQTYDYRLESSTDGQTWVMLATVAGASSWQRCTLTRPVGMRMIRVVNTSDVTELDISEVQAWVSPCTASSGYDSEGRLVAQVDGLGNTARFLYNGEGQLVWRADARGNADVLTYDTSGRLTRTADALGNSVTIAYDAAGRQTSVTDQLGSTSTTAHDAISRVLQTVSALNHQVSRVYDLAGRTTSTIETTYSSDGTIAGTATTSFSYDTLGRVVSSTDAIGSVTSYAYDAFGRPTVRTDARGYSVTSTYLSTGQVATSTNQVGVVTSCSYDANGRLTSTTIDSAAGGLALATRFSYDELDRLTQVTDPRGSYAGDPNFTTSYTYDARGNMTSRTDTNGTTTFAYDAADRLVSRTDPLRNTVYYQHDANGNIIGVTAPHATTVTNVASAANGTTVTGSSGYNWQYAIDGVPGTTQWNYTVTDWATSGYMTFVLPKVYSLEKIRVRLWDGDSRYSRYKTEVSADGVTWTLVTDKTTGEWRSWQDDTFAAQAAKYIRLTGTYCSSGWGFLVVELEAFEDDLAAVAPQTTNLTNVALASTGATVSGTAANLACLIDGNSTSYSGATGYADARWDLGQTMIVTLPCVYTLEKIRLRLWDLDGRYYRYKTEVSVDGSNWNLVTDKRQGMWQSWQQELFIPTQAKYIRLTGTYNSANQGFHVVELEAYAAASLRNVALAANGGASAFTVAIDGNSTVYDGAGGYTGTFWNSTPLPTMEFALPSLCAVERVRLRLWDLDSRFYRYRLDVSADGTKWECVVDKTNGEWRSWQDDSFAARPVKYLRLTGTYNSANIGFHIVEFEAYVDTAKTSYVYDAENRLTHQSDGLGRYIKHSYDAKGRRIATIYPSGGGQLPTDGTTGTYQYDAGDRLVSKAEKRATSILADCYRSTNTYAPLVLATFDAGTVGKHSLRVEWTGTRNTASTNTWLILDAFEVSNDNVNWTRIDGADPSVRYEGAWGQYAAAWAAGGSYHAANTAGAAACMPVNGRYVRYLSALLVDLGIARFTLEAAAPQAVSYGVDCYRSTNTYAPLVLATFDAGAVGKHSLRVEWTGTRNTASTNTWLILDAFEVSNDNVNWTRIDGADPSVRYEGAWGPPYAAAWAAGGSYHAANTAGAAACMPVNGRYVRYLSALLDDLGIARFTLASDDPAASSYGYDSGGNLTQRTDAAGTYSYQYDAADRLVSMLDATGAEVARYEYDGNGNCLTKVLTVGGVVTTTTCTYDPCNRVLTQVATRSGVTIQSLAYAYWSTGQLKTLTDNVAQTATTYIYDPAGQVISESVASGAMTTVRTYTYDGSGNRTTATTTGEPSYPLTQVEETSPHVAYTGAWSTWNSPQLSGGSYTYANASGASATLGFLGTRLALVARKGPEFGRARVYVDGVQTAEIDLYSAVTCYQQVVFDTGVLEAGRHHVRIEWTGLKNAAATGTSIGIDAFSLTGVEAQVAVRREQEASPVAYTGTWWTWTDPVHSGGSCTYANTAGASVTTTVVGSGFALIAQTGPEFGRARVYVDGIAQDIDLYSTSNRYQQTVLTKTLPCGSHTVRVEWTGTKNPASTGTNVSFDAIDAFSAAPDQALSFDAANRVVGYTYDTRGNVLSDGTHTYTWDAQNRLTTVKLTATGAVVASYAYDSDGMRQTATAGGVTTRFAVDAVSDEITALISATGVVVAQFVRDAAGALVAMVKGGATLTYLTNAHGDVTALLDAAGAVVARWTYDAWGVPTEYNAAGTQVATGTAGNPFLYAGYYYDTQTGHYYLRARYYDPATGRFLSMDPEPGGMSDRLSQNPYLYCQNDPVNLADPTGLRPDKYGGHVDNPTGTQQAEANKAANAAKKKAQQKAKDDDVRRLTVKDPSARVVLDADFAAAAQSTVYGAGKWISVNRPDHMGPGTWSLLGGYENRYGKNGPAKVSFAEVSVRERWASKPVLRGHGQVDLSAAAYAQYLVQVVGVGASEAYQLAWGVYESNNLTALAGGAVALRDSQKGMSDSMRASASRAFSSVWAEEWQKDGERLNAVAGTAAVASLLLTTLAAATTFRAAQALGTPAAVPLGVAAGLLTVGSLVSTAWYVNTTQTRTRRGFLSSDDPRNGDLGGGLTSGSVCSDAAGLAIGLAGLSTGAWWSTALGGIMSVPGWGCDFTSAAYELFNY